MMDKPKDSSVKFDSTINLGHIITGGTTIFAIIAGYFVLKSDIRDHESRLSRAEQYITQQGITNQNTNVSLNEIKTGVAVIRDRLERSNVGGPREVSPR